VRVQGRAIGSMFNLRKELYENDILLIKLKHLGDVHKQYSIRAPVSYMTLPVCSLQT
jgi:hypothetical protein